jgi:hypothetical protein
MRTPSRRGSRAVGRDLQFIRINGTLVGGLVGLALHALDRALRPANNLFRHPFGRTIGVFSTARGKGCKALMTATPATPLLDTVDTPADLRRLAPSQLRQLADELREEMISAVGQTGGHLGSAWAWWN